jgi:hypothetical protein
MPGTFCGSTKHFPGQAHNDGSKSLAFRLAGRPLVTTLLRQLGFRTPATAVGSRPTNQQNTAAHPSHQLQRAHQSAPNSRRPHTAITDETSPLHLRSTRHSPRTAMH